MGSWSQERWRLRLFQQLPGWRELGFSRKGLLQSLRKSRARPSCCLLRMNPRWMHAMIHWLGCSLLQESRQGEGNGRVPLAAVGMRRWLVISAEQCKNLCFARINARMHHLSTTAETRGLTRSERTHWNFLEATLGRNSIWKQ